MRPRSGRSAAALLILICAAAACSQSEEKAPTAAKPAATPDPAPAAAAPTQEELVARGRGIYMSNCAACHNADPKQPGSLGPEVAGSSRELLEHRVVRGDYPPGYTPKRDTRQMVPLPHLVGELDAIYAFLNQ